MEKKITRLDYARQQADAFKPIRIPVALHKELKVFCVKEGRSLGWVAEQAIKNYLKENK